MATRFIGKNIKNKIVRPIKNSVKYGKPYKTDETAATTVTEAEATVVEKKENKRQKKSKDNMNEATLKHLETIAGTNANVKIVKGDKGLYEHTQSSTIVLTEDNKMLLTD